jgi:hypothetical protein
MDRGFIELVEQTIPPGFFVRLIEEFEEDYSRSSSEPFGHFEEPEAQDLRGNERRARTETSLVYVSQQFAHKGIVAESRPNETYSHHHREVTAGPIVLTSSFVRTPSTLVPEARFRDSLARSRQLSLLEENGAVGKRLYAVILHGTKEFGGRRQWDTLGFFRLAIPNRALTAYEAIYDLAARYAETEVHPDDIAASLEHGVPIDEVRRPSTLLKQYRRRESGGA